MFRFALMSPRLALGSTLSVRFVSKHSRLLQKLPQATFARVQEIQRRGYDVHLTRFHAARHLSSVGDDQPFAPSPSPAGVRRVLERSSHLQERLTKALND
mmetsp:Transcript_8640/g.32524  ORF Transcript_8640/g.32524 Transcript_8640/m.32524 type:complete len:100 (-) Transcript_8640:1146-1445(-)